MKTENCKSCGFFNGDNHILFIIVMKDLLWHIPNYIQYNLHKTLDTRMYRTADFCLWKCVQEPDCIICYFLFGLHVSWKKMGKWSLLGSQDIHLKTFGQYNFLLLIILLDFAFWMIVFNCAVSGKGIICFWMIIPCKLPALQHCLKLTVPGAHFLKPPETFWAHKAIFRWSVYQNRELCKPEENKP